MNNSNNAPFLRLHFEDFEYDEMREILLDEDVLFRRSTLKDNWYVSIKPKRFDTLKLSLLVSNCIVKQDEDGINVHITRNTL